MHDIPLSSRLPPSLHKIGRVLKGGNMPSIAKAVFAHEELRKSMITKVLDLVTMECSVLCRKDPKNPSPFRHITLDKLSDFRLEDFIEELQTHAPTLFQIASAIARHNDHKNAVKKNSHHHPGLSMAVAILLKERNREMCGLQYITSLALFNSQVQKKVSKINHTLVDIRSHNIMIVIYI